MRTAAIARRFAKSLVDVGLEGKEYEKYGADLRGALEVFRANPELYKVLSNPMHKLPERVALMEKVSRAAGISAPVEKFLGILVELRQIKLLERILEAYLKLVDQISGRLRATVEAPVDLDEAALSDIKRKIESLTGKQVVISQTRNPALIAGVVIKIDNTIVDGSLRTQLELMKEKILEGVV